MCLGAQNMLLYLLPMQKQRGYGMNFVKLDLFKSHESDRGTMCCSLSPMNRSRDIRV